MTIRPLASRRNDTGATAVEYALIAALIAVVVVFAVVLLGRNLSGVFRTASSSLTGTSTTPVVAATAPTGTPTISFSRYECFDDDDCARLNFSLSGSNGGSPVTAYLIQRADDGPSDTCPGSGYSDVATVNVGSLPWNSGQRGDNCWRAAAVNAVGPGPFSSAQYYDAD